ncbi:MAG: hypothetical protein VX911_10080 [Candidatus Latescibacterota bacterium]|nr:hypothetical protein [Candidatus Latescibacterota bacterium]
MESLKRLLAPAISSDYRIKNCTTTSNTPLDVLPNPAEAQDNSNEEAVDEALDNLSDALEDLFSTCNWDNAQLADIAMRRGNALEGYALEDAITRAKGGKLQGLTDLLTRLWESAMGVASV